MTKRLENLFAWKLSNSFPQLRNSGHSAAKLAQKVDFPAPKSHQSRALLGSFTQSPEISLNFIDLASLQQIYTNHIQISIHTNYDSLTLNYVTFKTIFKHNSRRYYLKHGLNALMMMIKLSKYITSQQFKSMGNCAGSKSHPQANDRPANSKDNKQLAKPVQKVESLPRQQPSNNLHPIPQAKQSKQENASDEYPAVGSLQIESAKKEVLRDGLHNTIKQLEKKAQGALIDAVSPIKQSVRQHSFTFQNSAGLDEVAADENVNSFKNNHVNINFEIRAN